MQQRVGPIELIFLAVPAVTHRTGPFNLLVHVLIECPSLCTSSSQVWLCSVAVRGPPCTPSCCCCCRVLIECPSFCRATRVMSVPACRHAASLALIMIVPLDLRRVDPRCRATPGASRQLRAHAGPPRRQTGASADSSDSPSFRNSWHAQSPSNNSNSTTCPASNHRFLSKLPESTVPSPVR